MAFGVKTRMIPLGRNYVKGKTYALSKKRQGFRAAEKIDHCITAKVRDQKYGEGPSGIHI